MQRSIRFAAQATPAEAQAMAADSGGERVFSPIENELDCTLVLETILQ